MKKKPPIGRKQRDRVVSTRPTVAEIDLGAIAANARGIRERVGKSVKIMAVVKANAYGHGLERVSTALESGLADCFGVAFAEEGMTLRKEGIDKPILVFTLAAREQVPLYIAHKLEATVCSAADVELLQSSAAAQKSTVPVHLKIETGMNRIGVRRQGLREVVSALGRAKRLRLKGVFTHFATADERDKGFLKVQLSEFQTALDDLRGLKVEPAEIHCANSACILDAPETYFTMVRPGIMLYGHYPSKTTSESISLRPAMTLKTEVALTKRIESGESVSYGRRFVAKQRTTIATLPIGYADGVMRILTGRMHVLIGGTRFPVVGSVCMDQIMVDVGDAHVRRGDEAVIIGMQGNEQILAREVAEQAETIPYEVCCAVSSRVPRTYLS